MTSKADCHLTRDRHRLASLKTRLKARPVIIDALRSTFDSLGFFEVDTPSLIKAPAPEQHIDAIRCGNEFLITSPELQMKRLLAAGYGNIFQICHCFRDGERGDLHLPEFSMIEWYRTGADIQDLMKDCEMLVAAAAKSAGSFPFASRGGQKIDLQGPWERIDLCDAFYRFAGWRPGPSPDPDRFDRDLVSKVEPSLPLGRPVFLNHYPASMAALARLSPDNPDKAERFELYAGGLELANGFTELVDPGEQRTRFEKEAKSRESMNKTVYPMDEHFLGALELGLENCAGIALGLDRLIMLLTDAKTIDDVVAFPGGTL